MKVLVTGGCGFVGSHIVDALVARGDAVHIVDRLDHGTSMPPGVVELVQADVVELGELAADFDAIVHCAAHADVSRNWDSRDEREELWSDNVDATMNLLERAPERAHTVFLSTCAIYGDTRIGTPGDESRAYPSTSPYAASKLAGEALFESYAFAREVPHHTFRLGCVAGSRYHHGHVADFVRMAKAGGILSKSDGLRRKSFVHVADVVDVVLAALHRKITPGMYNVVGDAWSPRDTVEAMGNPPAEWPENKTHGWIGDPMAIASAAELCRFGLYCRRPIRDGILEALSWLGWPS